MRILVSIDDEVVQSVALAGALRVGRSPHNDLILQAADVSGHHAVVYWDADQVVVKDLGSTNGTRLNGEPVTTSRTIQPGDVVALGSATTLTLVEGPSTLPLWRVEREDADVAHPLRSFPTPLPGTDATLDQDDDGFWLILDGERTPLDERFTVDGVPWRLTEAAAPLAPTARPPGIHHYTLTVDLTNARAELTTPGSSTRCLLRSHLRASLLWVLAEQVTAHPDDPEQHWVDDEVLAKRVWGTLARRQGSNNLNVLVHRVRATAERGGFDGDFLEKRPGRTRLRVGQVELRRDG